MDKQVIRQDIYDIIKKAVDDGLNKIQELEASGKYIGHYYQFPKMETFESGFPNFSKSSLDDGPIDYSSISQKDLNPDDIDSWKSFYNLALTDPELNSYWEIRDSDLNSDLNNRDPFHHPHFFQFYKELCIYGSIKNLIDRYIHITGKKKFDENAFLPIYREWENGILLKRLTFDILIPILCQTFSFEKLELIPGISIEKMSEPLQKARNTESSFTVSVHDTVIGAATHALVLEGWDVANISLDKRNTPFYEISAFSEAIKKVNLFFAAFRIETGLETGFGQIISRPKGWADSWKAYLPSAYIVAIRAYPDYFENFGWLKKPISIEESTCESIAFIFNELLQAPDNRLLLAAKRLNAAFLRKNEEDSILDVTIGLETLLVVDSRNEITHRLSLRLAGLSKIEQFEKFSPKEVFDISKKVYAYRSAIVHGAKNDDQKRTIKIEKEKEMPILQLSISLLRYVISTLCYYPRFQDPKEIDWYLLTN
jgi:hypothetical protein